MKNSSLFIWLLLTACCLLPPAASATHLMGGWAGYQYLGINSATGNYQYRVTVKVYRYCDDTNLPCGACNTAGLDPSIQLGAYIQNFLNPNNPNKILAASFILPLTSQSWVPLPGAAQCATAPTVCVQEGIYTLQIELPASNGGYHLFFERCCRNGNIINLSNPGAEGQTYYAFIPPTFITNSSPTFAQPPVPYICVDDTASILNTAFDPDGDVLVYSLVQPFTGYSSSTNPVPTPANPYTFPIPLVNYASGYSATQPFGAGGYASVNGFTGLSQYLSPSTGNYVVAVELQEYRNNQLVGVTRLDIQIIVINCPPNNAPTLSSTTTQISYVVNVGDSLCFPITFNDANGDSVFFTGTGNIFSASNPPATLIPNPNSGLGTVTSQFCWDLSCSQAGNYIFIVQVPDNGCPPKVANLVYTIQVLPYTGPNSITGPNPTCANSLVTYSVPASSGASFLWAVTGGVISSGQGTNSITVNWGSSGNGTVNVTSSLANGCSAGPLSSSITIQPIPVINAGTNATICSGNSVGLTSGGGGTYSWSPSTGLSGTNISNPIAYPTSSTNYIVTVTSAIGCSNTDTVSISVNQQPVVNAGSDNTLCSGFSTTIGGSPTGPAGSTYNWSTSTGLSSTTSANPTASPTATITYTVTVTALNTCTDTAFVTVTVNQPPVANAGADFTICAGSSATLSGSGGGIYNWSPSSGLSASTISNPVASPTASTTYTLVVALNNCTDTAFVSLTTHPIPAVNAGADVSICLGNPTTLNAAGTGSFLWSPSIGLSCTTCTNPNANPTSTTNYTVTITDANTCTNNDVVQVAVNPLPLANAGPRPAWVCPGFGITLSSFNGISYAWVPSATLSNPTISNPIATPTSTTTYTVNITDANGCANWDTVTITRTPSVPTDAGSDPIICVGQSVTIGGMPTAPLSASYQWFPSAGLNNTTLANPVANPIVTTTYVLTTASDTCSGTDTVVVYVNSLPTINAGVDVSICIGDSTTLSASGGISYLWNTNATTTSISVTPTSFVSYTVVGTDMNGCSNLDSASVFVNLLPAVSAGNDVSICMNNSITLTGSGGQTYVWSTGETTTSISVTPTSFSTYTITGTDANGCSNLDSASVFVNLLPVVSAGNDITGCINNSVLLTGSGGQIYVWSTGETTTSISVAPTSSSTYTVTGTDINGCSNNDSVTVFIGITPVANFGYALSLDCEGIEAQFTDSSQNALNWSWNFGDGNFSSLQNPIHTFPYNVTHIITLIAINPPCSDTLQKTISFSEFSNYISTQTSNVFTPNSDGINDCFQLTLKATSSLVNRSEFEDCAELTIYNRWGIPVYHSEHSNSCWDGRTSAGLSVPEGTYFYVFDLNGISLKGFITLLQ